MSGKQFKSTLAKPFPFYQLLLGSTHRPSCYFADRQARWQESSLKAASNTNRMNLFKNRPIFRSGSGDYWNCLLFREEAFWAALTDSSHSFCLLHSPFLLRCQGAERQLGEVLGIFLLNLYPETQTTRWGTVSCLAQGRSDRNSFSGWKKILFWILKNPTPGIALTLVHRQPSRAPALLYSSSFSERLFAPSLWDLLIFAAGCVQPR